MSINVENEYRRIVDAIIEKSRPQIEATVNKIQKETWSDFICVVEEKVRTIFNSVIQDFYSGSDILSSKLLGGIIDAGSTILGILDSISKLLGGLPGDLTGIAVAISAALSFKNVGEPINQFQFLIILRIEYAHEAFN